MRPRSINSWVRVSSRWDRRRAHVFSPGKIKCPGWVAGMLSRAFTCSCPVLRVRLFGQSSTPITMIIDLDASNYPYCVWLFLLWPVKPLVPRSTANACRTVLGRVQLIDRERSMAPVLPGHPCHLHSSISHLHSSISFGKVQVLY